MRGRRSPAERERGRQDARLQRHSGRGRGGTDHRQHAHLCSFSLIAFVINSQQTEDVAYGYHDEPPRQCHVRSVGCERRL
jgi:hypothetical protein